MNEETALTLAPKTIEADLPSLFKLAETLVTTGFLPDTIRTPAQAVAIILAGRELGIGPMLSLRTIGIIKGKVILSADLQLAQFKKLGGKAAFEKLTDTEASLILIHPNGDQHRETFTMEDAKRAGLVRPAGNWTTFPKAMLRSRAITAGLKSVGFEPTCGAYDPDEAQHFSPPTRPTQTKPNDADADFGPSALFKLSLAPAPSIDTPKAAGTPLSAPTKPIVASPEEIAEKCKARFLALCNPVKFAAWVWATESGVILNTERMEAGRAFKFPNTKELFDAAMGRIKEIADETPDGFKQAQYATAYVNDSEPEPPVAKVDEVWRGFLMPFGKQAGKPMADLDKKYLYGLWANFEVEETYKGHPRKPETIGRERQFRLMLDEAGAHYEFTKS